MIANTITSFEGRCKRIGQSSKKDTLLLIQFLAKLNGKINIWPQHEKGVFLFDVHLLRTAAIFWRRDHLYRSALDTSPI